jgi:hypothetical protein
MKHPIGIDLLAFLGEQPADRRELLAHILVCKPCRQDVINMIQWDQNYPDLYANPEGKPDITLEPHPHTLVCPGCGLVRNLPEGWQEILKSKILSCVDCGKVMVEQ